MILPFLNEGSHGNLISVNPDPRLGPLNAFHRKRKGQFVNYKQKETKRQNMILKDAACKKNSSRKRRFEAAMMCSSRAASLFLVQAEREKTAAHL